MDSVDFFEKPRKPLKWCKWSKRWQWKAVEKPRKAAMICHTPPKKPHVRNKWSMSSLKPQLTIQPCSDTSNTFQWKSLSLVGIRLRNDDSIISLFYIIFNLVLFRFKFILYYCYFLFELFTLRFNKLYFRNEYWVEQSWSKRKMIRSWFGLEKCKIQHKNMQLPSQKLGTAVPPLRILFCLDFKLLCFSLGPQFLVEHSSIIVA